MKKPLHAAALAAVLLCVGCPDATQSRDPRTVDDITQLKTELAGLSTRMTALEGRDKQELKALEARLNDLERGQKPVTVNLNISGAGVSTGGPVEVKQGSQGTAQTPGTEPSGPQQAPSPKPGTQPGTRPDVDPVRPGKTKLAQRFGIDAWNELVPRAADEQPRRGGKVRLRFSAQPEKLNPHLDNSAVTQYITGYVYETLVEQNGVTFDWEPLLADRWTAEDMLFEVTGADPIEGVSFSVSQQKWIKNEGKDDAQTWFPWEVRKTAEGKHEVLKLAEHIGQAKQIGADWEVTDASGAKQTYAGARVAGVNVGTVFTFHVRENATFHDGHPVTADDVVFSLGYTKCEFVDAPSSRAYYDDVRPAEKIDGHTVRIIYKKQYFKAFEFAGGILVLPKHIFDPENLLQNDPKKFGDYFNKHPRHRSPLGSGPYQFVSWDEGKSVTVKRYEGYHSPAKGGYIDEITWKFIPEDQAAIAELRANNLDFVPEMPPEQFFKETTDAEFLKTFVKPVYYYGNFGYVGWNMRKPPFNDPKVRRAMAHGALDIQKFIDNVLYGAATQVCGSQYLYGPVYDHSIKPYAFDPELARKLLREAGWFDRNGDGVIENADGVPFEFDLLMPSGRKVTRDQAQIMQDNLSKLGIKMGVKELEWAIFLKDINKRNFDACRLGWGQPIESDPFQLWHSSASENEGSNHCGFINPEADQIILELRQTLDLEKRKELNSRFQHILYETQPYLFLYCSPMLGAYRPQLHGVRFTPLRPGYDLREWYIVDVK
ncbi:MAG: ABC transporter substrate-binding protein [Planctomycetota bacterium]